MDQLDSEEGAKRLHVVGTKVYENSGYGNFAPTLIIVPEESDEVMIALMPEMEAGRAYAYVQQAIISMGVIPRIVAFSADVFMHDLSGLTEEEKENAIGPNRMSLADLFAINDPTVHEALVTQVMSAEGQYIVNQRYKYTPVDGFEWGQIITSNESTGWDFNRLINGEPKLDTQTGHPLCPLCGGFIPDNEQPGAYRGAISRKDNKTEICSACGVREAFQGLVRPEGGWR
jgi:hypothetical protein